MEGEPRHEPIELDQQHVDDVPHLLGVLRAELMDGAYDVLRNHHEDVIVLTSGEHQVEHRLTRAEAEMLEQAVWSAGEDQSLDRLVENIVRQLGAATFALKGDQLDITVKLREAEAS